MTTPWQIELLGWLRATMGDQVVTRFRTRKDGALLAFLAYHPHRSHPRDYLCELLWPEVDPDTGRHRLRMVLSSLRRQLEPPGVPPGAVILTDRRSVQLNPVTIVTDVARFEAALLAAARPDDAGEPVRHLEAAVGLYRGALLPEYDEAWVLSERERLAEAHSEALRRLTEVHAAAGDHAVALQWARRGVSADPLREEAHREVIRLLVAAGQEDAARRQYATLERLLAEELDAVPEAETRVLIGADGRSGAPLPERPAPPVTAPGASATPAAPPTGSLPLQFKRFFGREVEIRQLEELLLSGSARMVTLTGPGGCGKTRLAQAAAGRLRDAFDDAVWFVPLADLADPRLIAGATLDRL